MAGDTNSNIFINIDTSQAMAQLRALEKQITSLNRSLIVGTKAASQAQSKYAQSLLHNVNATGQWTASVGRMKTATEQFSTALDKGKLSLKEYFRYGMASTRTFGRFFGSEFDTVGKLVEKRVKTLQHQYVQLGRDAQGAMNALKFTPKALNYRDVTTQLMMATQRQQIFNKLLDDGSTKLLNFGKNTQWAGRQLMVGFTIPLMLFGSQAIRTFKEIETQVIRFKKVYGDIFSDQGATDQALKNIQKLADEYTKYGLKVSETIKTAADAAAAGFSGKGLEDLVRQTNKLAVLGGVTQEKALETTIALRNAFQIDEKQLSGTIDFLNAVENQTVVALDDLTEAIPRVAPVVQQLGGDIKDLSFFMAAMQEGGISAAQGANALKSGLASLINPSDKAAKSAAALGINLKGIVEENEGNLRNIVMAFAKSLQPLTDLQRSQIIEQIFGKFQFARISALLNNITKEGSQAARVLQLANASAEELAILSQRELKIQADSPMNRLAGAVEKLKAAIAPVGKLFAEVLTPVIEYIGKMAERFNKLPEGVKKAVAVILGIVGGLGPIFLMTFGLIANAFANTLKGVNLLRKGYQQLAYGSGDVALKTQYLTTEELENISVTNALYSKHEQLSAAYRLEQQALASLIGTYTQANTAMGRFAANNPGLFVPGRGVPPKRFADGTTSVPGPKGAGDIVPSMLSPGEAVIPAKQSQKYAGFISQIIQDKVPGFFGGRFPSLSPVVRTSFADELAFGPARGVMMGGSGVRTGQSLIAQRGIDRIRIQDAGADMVRVTVGDSSILMKKRVGGRDQVSELTRGLKENQDWLDVQGGVKKKGAAADTSEKLERIIKSRLAGKKGVSAKEIIGKLQKADVEKKREVPKEVKSLRAKYRRSAVYQAIRDEHEREIEVLKAVAGTRNPYGITGSDVITTAKASRRGSESLEVGAGALSHRVPAASKVPDFERNAPWNIFEEQSFLNKYFQDVSKTSSLGGKHVWSRADAIRLRSEIARKPLAERSSVEKLTDALLDYRINYSNYYDKFGSRANQYNLLRSTGLTKDEIAALPRFADPMRLANGIVSVPGPKGAGDIQPAMLSPGEAVIPAKQSQKYMPLIRSIVADKVPGFAGSNIDDPWDTPSNTPKSRADIAADRMANKLAEATTKKGIVGRIARGVAGSIDRAVNAGPDLMTSRERVSATRPVPMPAFSDLKESVDKNTKAVQGGTDATDGSTKTAKEAAREQRKLARTQGPLGYMRGFGNVPNVDPETGAKLNYAQRMNYRQNERMQRTGRLMGPSMAASMAGSMAMMYGMSKPDTLIGQNMNLIMGFTMLAGLLPLLNSPLKMMIAGVVGLVALYKLQGAQIKQSIIDGQNQGKAMMMTTDNLEALGKITGTVSITQEEEMKRRARTTEIVPVSMDFGKNLITNEDYGKQLKATFDKTVEQMGAGAAVESLSNQLATAVSQGVLTGVQAESIAVAITRDLRDARLETQVRGRLIQLIGPRGEDVLKDPLQVQLDIIASGQKIQKTAFENLQRVIGQQRSGQLGIGGEEAKQLAIGAIPAAGAGLYAANKTSKVLSAAKAADTAVDLGTDVGKMSKVLNIVRATRLASMAATSSIAGAIPGIIGTVVFGGIELGLRKFQQGQEKKAIGQAAGIYQAISAENLKASQQSLDALNVEIGIAIKNLEAKKKAAKTAKERADIENRILDLENQRVTGSEKIRVAQGNILKTLADQYGQIGKETFFENILPGGPGRGALRQKFMESFDVGLQQKFKENAVARAQLAGTNAMLEQKYGTKGDEITLQIKTLISSDVLTPREAGLVVANLSSDTKLAKKELETMVTVLGTEGLQRLGTILTYLPKEKNRKNLQVYVQSAGKEKADEVMSALEEIIKFPNYLGININLETQKDDIKDLARVGKEIADIQENFPEGKVTKKLLIDMQEKAGGKGKNLTLDNAITQWETISKLPKSLQFQAIISIGSISQSDSFDKIIDRELEAAFYKENPQLAMNFVDPKREAAKKRVLEAYKKDTDNIAEATAQYWKKTAPEIWGNEVGDDSVVPPPKKEIPGAEGGKKGSWIQDIAQRLRLVKEASLDATKGLAELRRFYGKGSEKTNNQFLQFQQGALKQIKKEAKDAGIVLSTEFLNIIESFDATEFKTFLKDFTVFKDGKVKGLKDDFLTINASLRSLAAGELIKKIDDENKAIQRQVDAYKILVKEGYSRLEIERILNDEIMMAMIAEQGFLSLSIDERKNLNNEVRETISLKRQESLLSIGKTIEFLEAQVQAYDELNKLQLDQAVILRILQDEAFVYSVIAKEGVDDIIAKTKKLLELEGIVAKWQEERKTKEEKFIEDTQKGIDDNIAELDRQARILQNAFDLDPVVITAKANIASAQKEIDRVNGLIKGEQDKIDKINLQVKYDKVYGDAVIADLQETISDAQRVIEERFDRPIQALQNRSNILSNDLSLMDKAVEDINKKYDAQFKALEKVQEANQKILDQQKRQISLADALTQGDISAAAQAIQDIRASNAEAALASNKEILDARKAREIELLRSSTGMTRLQIEEEQFRISQQIFALEQQRKINQDAIVKLEDDLYNKQEQREIKLLAIRDIERIIDGYRANELATAQKRLDDAQAILDKKQATLDAELAAIDAQKTRWEAVQLALDAYKAKIKEITDGPLKTMLDMITNIANALKNVGIDYSFGNLINPELRDQVNDAFKKSDDAQKKQEAAQKKADDAWKEYEESENNLQVAEDKLDGLLNQYTELSSERDDLLKQATTLSKLWKSGKTTSAKKLVKNIIGVNGAGGGEYMTMKMNKGGLVNPQYFAAGGFAKGADKIPAMLSPGEFVVSKYGVQSYGVDRLRAINSGQVSQGSVYNYSINVSVDESGASADDIARVVIRQIQQLDGQRIRRQAV